MTKPVVVYTDLPWAIDRNGQVDPARAIFERQVYGDQVELRFAPANDGRYQLDSPEFFSLLQGAAGLVIHRCQITPEILDACGQNLQVVGRQGVGHENLAPELLRQRGIIGYNVPDYCIDEVATHTLALALALERGLVAQHNALAAGEFNIYAGGKPRRLQNCVAGIIGFGRIGRVVCSRLKMFCREVLACDPYVDRDVMQAYGARQVDQQTLLQQADIVSLHCLLSAATRGLLDATALGQMKPTAVLINTARGALVDSQALHAALSEHRIAGAGLDVFSPENPHDDPWNQKTVQLPHVIATSHRAFYSDEGEQSQRRRTSESMLHVLTTGQPPQVGQIT